MTRLRKPRPSGYRYSSRAIGPYQEAGDTTAIPDGTELLGVSRDGSGLEVDVSSRFESGGGRLSMQQRLAQLVYTGTQFEGIEALQVLIHGEQVDSIGGEGVDVSEPLTRRDFEDVAPFIVVESPKPGEEVTSPVTVNGFANVFEGTVDIVIRDKSSDVLEETLTTATCGTGCWGDFSEAVAFEVDERQKAESTCLHTLSRTAQSRTSCRFRSPRSLNATTAWLRRSGRSSVAPRTSSA